MAFLHALHTKNVIKMVLYVHVKSNRQLFLQNIHVFTYYAKNTKKIIPPVERQKKGLALRGLYFLLHRTSKASRMRCTKTLLIKSWHKMRLISQVKNQLCKAIKGKKKRQGTMKDNEMHIFIKGNKCFERGMRDIICQTGTIVPEWRCKSSTPPIGNLHRCLVNPGRIWPYQMN